MDLKSENFQEDFPKNWFDPHVTFNFTENIRMEANSKENIRTFDGICYSTKNILYRVDLLATICYTQTNIVI